MTNTNYSKPETFTRNVAFRITEAQYQGFHELKESLPGSDVGNLYREIFLRGLKALTAFCAKKIKTDGSDMKKGV